MLKDAIVAYLEETQSEALNRLFQLRPQLQASSSAWTDWQYLEFTLTDVIGSFLSMTGWERLEPMIGSIELLERPAQDDNHVTEAWLCVQIVAIAEAIKTSSDLSEVFALTELLTKRWESFRKFADGSNEVDIVLLRSEIKRNMQKKAGAALHVDTNLIKQLAWRLFEANSTSDHVLSGKELLALLTSQDAIQKVYQSQDKAHVVAFEAENSESVTFKEKISGRYISIAKSTLNNWRTRFAKRLQHDDLK